MFAATAGCESVRGTCAVKAEAFAIAVDGAEDGARAAGRGDEVDDPRLEVCERLEQRGHRRRVGRLAPRLVDRQRRPSEHSPAEAAVRVHKGRGGLGAPEAGLVDDGNALPAEALCDQRVALRQLRLARRHASHVWVLALI